MGKRPNHGGIFERKARPATYPSSVRTRTLHRFFADLMSYQTDSEHFTEGTHLIAKDVELDAVQD
jgi:hypothetical protein